MLLWLLACDAPSVVPEDTAPTPIEPVPERIEVLSTRSCRGDRNQTPFLPYEEEGWDTQLTSRARSRFMIGVGVGVADLDGDEQNDVLLPKNGEVLAWFGSDGGLDRPLQLARGGEYTAAVPVDYDGDGDLDVYISRYDGPDLLMQNDGPGGFHDVADAAGLGSQQYGIGSSWADMDGDGDLDLLALKHGNWLIEESVTSRLYRSKGDGTFEDVTAVHFEGDDMYGHTLAGGFMDLDLDGLPEIYIVNDYGWILPNQMFWNRPEGFERSDPSVGLSRPMCGMGLAETDIDGDEVPDLFHSSWLELRLLATAGTGIWIDFTQPAGFLIQEDLNRHVAWGADFGDIDNDGDDDLWIGFGAISANIHNPPLQPDALYMREGNRMVERSFQLGVADPRTTRGGVLVDVDGDGWLDLLKRNKDRLPVLLHGACGEGNWLQIQLMDDGPNTRGVGAKIRVSDATSDHVKWVRAGGRSLASGGPPELHFGLGERGRVDVEVTWPDGEVEMFEGIDANQRIRIHR